MNTKEMICWLVGMLLVAAVCVSPVACTMARHSKIEKAIADGADPIAAKCAIEFGIENQPMCVAYAARRGN